MGSYDLYRELEVDPTLASEAIADLLDRRIKVLLGEGLSPTSPAVDQLITGRAVLTDPVKRDSYDAALSADDGQVTVPWLHLLADAPRLPRRAQGADSLGVPIPDSASERRSRGENRHARAHSDRVYRGVGGRIGS